MTRCRNCEAPLRSWTSLGMYLVDISRDTTELTPLEKQYAVETVVRELNGFCSLQCESTMQGLLGVGNGLHL